MKSGGSALQLSNWHGWKSLVVTSYRVDYKLGSQAIHEKLVHCVPPGNLTAVQHEANGIKKLLAGNTDIFINEESSVRQMLASPAFRDELSEVFGLTAFYDAGMLEEVTVHAFLNQRYRELAKDLSAVLKKMKSEKIWESYLQELSKACKVKNKDPN